MSQSPEIVLTIKLHADGRVEISGPIDNRMLCFGLLELAKESVHQRGEKEQSVIKTANSLQALGLGN